MLMIILIQFDVDFSRISMLNRGLTMHTQVLFSKACHITYFFIDSEQYFLMCIYILNRMLLMSHLKLQHNVEIVVSTRFLK